MKKKHSAIFVPASRSYIRPGEGGALRQICIRISPDLLEKASARAKADRVTFPELVRQAVEDRCK